MLPDHRVPIKSSAVFFGTGNRQLAHQLQVPFGIVETLFGDCERQLSAIGSSAAATILKRNCSPAQMIQSADELESSKKWHIRDEGSGFLETMAMLCYALKTKIFALFDLNDSENPWLIRDPLMVL